MSRRRITEFTDQAGVRRELRDPDGQPTGRQLAALWRAGALRLGDADPAGRFTRGEAAAAIDDLVTAGQLERPAAASPEERFDRVCREIVAFVDANPGCTTTLVVAGVCGRRGYVAGRVRDLLELGALVDRAGRRGRRGRRRELWLSTNDAGDPPAGRTT